MQYKIQKCKFCINNIRGKYQTDILIKGFQGKSPDDSSHLIKRVFLFRFYFFFLRRNQKEKVNKEREAGNQIFKLSETRFPNLSKNSVYMLFRTL